MSRWTVALTGSTTSVMRLPVAGEEYNFYRPHFTIIAPTIGATLGSHASRRREEISGAHDLADFLNGGPLPISLIGARLSRPGTELIDGEHRIICARGPMRKIGETDTSGVWMTDPSPEFEAERKWMLKCLSEGERLTS